MEPRVAYIDYMLGGMEAFLMELEDETGLEIPSARDLDEFCEEYNLETFRILFYHPGIDQQDKIRDIRENYPKLTLAILAGEHIRYKAQKGVYFLSSDIGSLSNFIRNHLKNTDD